jgi:hypothetical protein
VGVPGARAHGHDTPHIFHTKSYSRVLSLTPEVSQHGRWWRENRDRRAGHRKHGARSDLQDCQVRLPCAVSISCWDQLWNSEFMLRDIRPSRPRPSAPGHDPFLWSDRSWHLQFMKFSGKQEFSHCNFECVQRRTLSTQSVHHPSRTRCWPRTPALSRRLCEAPV